MMRELTQSEADSIKAFLLETPVDRPVHLEFPDIRMTVDVAGAVGWDWDPEGRDLTGPEGSNALTYQGRSDILYLQVCDWSGNRRLNAVHIVLGSLHPALDERFAQIELGDCLIDGDNVYLVKSTRLGGRGAIRRLRRGTKDAGTPTGNDFSSRMDALIRRLGARTVRWDETDLVVIATIPMGEMVRQPRQLLPQVLEHLLRYAGEVETLRSGACSSDSTDVARSRPGERIQTDEPLCRLAPRQKKSPESVGRSAATEWLESRGYSVLDVSADDLGYDLLASMQQESLCVKVKVTTDEKWAVELTADEMRAAVDKQEQYMLAVVVLGEGDSPSVTGIRHYINPAFRDDLVVSQCSYTVRPAGGGS